MSDYYIYKELDIAFNGTRTQLAKMNEYMCWCCNIFLYYNNSEISGIRCNLHLCILYWCWCYKIFILRRKI